MPMVSVRNKFGVRKIVSLAMSCSIDANNFGSKLKLILARKLLERGKKGNKSSEDQHK
jgi:hypothetical protein